MRPEGARKPLQEIADQIYTLENSMHMFTTSSGFQRKRPPLTNIKCMRT